MTAPVLIYSSRGCGWAKRNYAALLEKQVSFHLLSANDSHGQRTSDFLSLSPAKKTPVLSHQDAAVWDSRIINEYIEEAFTGISLLPGDPAMHARARSLNCYCDDVLMSLTSRIARADELTNEVSELKDAMVLLENFAFPVTNSGPFWAGSAFSLVDICYLNFFDSVAYITDVADKLDFSFSNRLNEWRSAIDERPSIVRAVKIADTFATNGANMVVTP